MGFTKDANSKPVYNNDIADPVGQFQAAVDYAEDEFLAGVAAFANLPSSGNWPGRHRYVIAEKSWYTWVDTNTGWIPDTNETAQSLSFVDIYTNANATYEPVKATVQGGRVFLEGVVTNTIPATFVFAEVKTLGTVPAALAPARVHNFPATWGGTGLASVMVGPNGVVQYQLSSGASNVPAGQFLLSLSGISWRLKRR